jgi:hypothetical protein
MDFTGNFSSKVNPSIKTFPSFASMFVNLIAGPAM